jgi:hypothetical protein
MSIYLNAQPILRMKKLRKDSLGRVKNWQEIRKEVKSSPQT